MLLFANVTFNQATCLQGCNPILSFGHPLDSNQKTVRHNQNPKPSGACGGQRKISYTQSNVVQKLPLRLINELGLTKETLSKLDLMHFVHGFIVTTYT